MDTKECTMCKGTGEVTTKYVKMTGESVLKDGEEATHELKGLRMKVEEGHKPSTRDGCWKCGGRGKTDKSGYILWDHPKITTLRCPWETFPEADLKLSPKEKARKTREYNYIHGKGAAQALRRTPK